MHWPYYSHLSLHLWWASIFFQTITCFAPSSWNLTNWEGASQLHTSKVDNQHSSVGEYGSEFTLGSVRLERKTLARLQPVLDTNNTVQTTDVPLLFGSGWAYVADCDIICLPKSALTPKSMCQVRYSIETGETWIHISPPPPPALENLGPVTLPRRFIVRISDKISCPEVFQGRKEFTLKCNV